MNEEVVRLLADSLKEVDPTGWTHAASLALLAPFAPDDALRGALSLLQADPWATIHHFKQTGPVSSEVLGEILTEAVTRPFPDNAGFVRLLKDTGHGDVITGALESTPPDDFVIADIVINMVLDWDNRTLAGPHGQIEAALAGELGDHPAYSLAVLAQPGALKGRKLGVWAEVGHWEVELEAGHYRDLPISSEDGEEAERRFSEFTVEQLRDPVAMLAILRSLAACMHECSERQLAAVVDLWSRVGPLFDTLETGIAAHTGNPMANLMTIGSIANHIAVAQDWERLWPIQREVILRFKGQDWAGNDPILRDALGGDAGSSDDSRLFEVAMWGSSVGVPTIESFPRPKDTSSLFELIFRHCDPSFLSMEDNLDDIAKWLRRAGILGAWRSRLLDLPRIK
jgi:hypothetical protein